MESPAPPREAPSRWAGLKLRTVSAALLAAAALLALLAGGWLFIALVVAFSLQMIREWDGLLLTDSAWGKLIGVAYVGVPAASLIWLRQLQWPDYPHAGAAVVLYVLLVVWATDIGAFFAGRRIGGSKLAPAISPNKTWAGLGGGIVAAAVAGAVCSSFTPYPPSAIAALDLGIVLALLAQAGDLLESWLKRRAGVKDSGTLIPGHGGLLDRVDGLILTLPVFALLLASSGVRP